MKFLTEQEIREQAPAVYTTHPRHDVSDKYSYVPTYDIIDKLNNLDWLPVSASQQKSEDNWRYGKHIVKLQHRTGMYDRDGRSPQIILHGSHDRTNKLLIGMGILEWICSNGLFVADGYAEAVVQRHMGFTYAQMKLRLEDMVKRFETVYNKIDDYKTVELTEQEKNYFALSSVYKRWNKKNSVVPAVKPEDVLMPRRTENVGNDLWNVYNVIQENLMKGGLPFNSPSGRANTTRKVTGMQDEVRINSALWIMMEAIRRAKG